jgi:peptide/nickel transport system permease protein
MHKNSFVRLQQDKRAIASIFIILIFIALPLVGPSIYQHIGGSLESRTRGLIGPSVYHNPFQTELSRQDEGSSVQHWLGTDSLGRDFFARLMQGMLISLTVAVSVEIVSITIGIGVGVCAGFFGGLFDQWLARFTDVMFAFPGLLFAILVTGIFGPQSDLALSNAPLIGANGNARLLVVSLALAMTTWPLMARLVRGQTLQLKQQLFIEAARASGASRLYIIRYHIIPNLFSSVFVIAPLDLSMTIIREAGLSFLGLGVQIPGSSLGLMISEARGLVGTPYSREVFIPSIILALIVLAFSSLGDSLRDAFDPSSIN